MNLIDAFENGHIFLIDGKPEKIVETWISKVFFCQGKAYKVYKNIHTQFTNLQDEKKRKCFYLEDFSWNKTVCPEIYEKLIYCKQVKNEWVLTKENDAENIAIEMKRLKEKDNLNVKLSTNNISELDLKNLTKALKGKLDDITESKRRDFVDFFNLGWYELFKNWVDEVMEFSQGAKSYIGESRMRKVKNYLYSVLEETPYFKEYDKNKLVVGIDSFSPNVYLVDNKIFFIDSMYHNRRLSVVEKYYNICRMANDVRVIGDKNEYADFLYNNYTNATEEVPQFVKKCYEVFNSYLNGSFMCIVKAGTFKKEYGEKYLNYLDQANL